MAATFPPLTALNYVSNMIKYMPIGRISSNFATPNGTGNFLNDASNLIWMAAPWRWATNISGPITITQNTTSSAITVPTDFLRLEKVAISNGNSWREVKPIGQIQSTPGLNQWPNYAAITGTAGGAGTIAFDSLIPDTGWKAWFWYKKIAPIITSANYSTGGVLVMDDEWWWVYNEAVLYYAYKYADDPRAGTAEVAVTPQGTQIKYSGQIAVVHGAIEEMRRSEMMVMGYPQAFPDVVKDH